MVDFLEDLKEVMEEWLKRIIRDLFGRAMNINMEKGIIQGVHMIIRGNDTMHEGGLGGWGRHQWVSIMRGASIGSITHHHDQMVGICRNQYVFM